VQRREFIALSGVALATARRGAGQVRERRVCVRRPESRAGSSSICGTIEPSDRHLYECSQQSDDVTTFAIDPDSGRLTERSRFEAPLAGVVSFATNAE
jgi:hypothetical protein